jgi:hypothetical protein
MAILVSIFTIAPIHSGTDLLFLLYLAGKVCKQHGEAGAETDRKPRVEDQGIGTGTGQDARSTQR